MKELTEQLLRQLLCAPHGEACGIAILDCVANDKPLVVVRCSGETTTLAEIAVAMSFLRELGWERTYKIPRIEWRGDGKDLREP